MKSSIMPSNEPGSKRRADVLIAEQLEISRSQVSRLFKSGHVSINGEVRYAPGLMTEDDQFDVDLPKKSVAKPEVQVLYEDGFILVIDKPSGVLSQPRGSFETEPTLVSLNNDDTLERGGLVHRLDRETSGVMVLAKTPEAQKQLSQQFADRQIVKVYNAVIAQPLVESPVKVDAPIARQTKNPSLFRVHSSGKSAITSFSSVTKVDSGYLIEARPETGRTHQIRVHLKYLDRPIIGDDAYSGIQSSTRLLLHSSKLEFTHPETNEVVSFASPLPTELK